MPFCAQASRDVGTCVSRAGVDGDLFGLLFIIGVFRFLGSETLGSVLSPRCSVVAMVLMHTSAFVYDVRL